MIFEISKLLSLKRIFFTTGVFSDWKKMNNYYFPKNTERARIMQPMYVIILQRVDSFRRFQEISNEMVKEKGKTFLVFFMKTIGQSLINFCLNPVGSPFAMRLDSSMIVKCHGNNTLRQWYTTDGNTMSVLNWAIWNPNTKFMKKLNGRKEKINLRGKKLIIGAIHVNKCNNFYICKNT